MTQVTRTFHPVGQGAFYSEIFNCKNKNENEKTFKVVYDCGSSTLAPNKLKLRINSELANDTNIDILFISHFDQDHISGVTNLNPKVVIIPFLSEQQKTLLRLYNTVHNSNRYEVRLIDNPSKLFPNAKIIRVKPIEEEGSEANRENAPLRLDINEDINKDNISETSITIRSNSSIQLCNSTPFWEYIPFNPNWDKYVAKFKEYCINKQLDWTKLTASNNNGYIKDNLKTLKGIYKQLGNLNQHSLVVYSNAELNINPYVSILSTPNPLPSWLKTALCYISRLNNNGFATGCIYFGDITFSAKLENSFYKYLSNTKRLLRVGTLQVPHHGSYLSNKKPIISSKHPCHTPVLCVISVGQINRYRHPSVSVIKMLKQNKGIVHLVTENCSSRLYSIICF